MPAPDPVTQRFEPDPASATAARRFAVGAVRTWGLTPVVDDIAICTAELATNAILHTRSAFTVSVRPLVDGARLDVLDSRPDQLPAAVPSPVGAVPLGTTGRGILIVATVARRWGYFTTDVAKTVWVELGPRAAEQPVPPVVELARRPVPAQGPTVRLLNLPVSAAVASGVQVDDLVRAIQLNASRLDEPTRSAFFALLDRCAAIRLVGRHAALQAAGEGKKNINLEVPVSEEELLAMTELTALLERVAGPAGVGPVPVGADVTAMRAWLAREVAAQHRGQPPTPFPNS